jgi:hypothetical protein
MMMGFAMLQAFSTFFDRRALAVVLTALLICGCGRKPPPPPLPAPVVPHQIAGLKETLNKSPDAQS